ncbi:hypothetical protein [[Eubacterium] cellulosolvens]
MKTPINHKVVSTVFIVVVLLFSGIFVGTFNFNTGSEVSENVRTAAGADTVSTSAPENTANQPARTRASTRNIDDVGIWSISDIDKDQFNLDHYPGTDVHMNVTVKNYGTNKIIIPFEIVLTVSDGTTQPPSYHYQENKTFPTCIGLTEIGANQSLNISWNWTPPLHMPHGCQKNFTEGDISFTAYFTTMLEGDTGSNNNQKWIRVDVNQPDFIVNLESGWFGIPESDKLITIISGEPNLFQLNFTLFNDGKGTYINFSTIAPTDWKAIPPARKYYNDRTNSTSENLSITIFPSVNLQHIPTATWLYITLKAVCESYPLAFDTVTFRVKVRFRPYPQIIVPEVPEGEIYRVPPGEAFIDFKVYNKGNGEDNFVTSAQVGQSSWERAQLMKTGWDAVVHSGKITRILKRGEYQYVTVKVFVPKGVRAGSPCPVKLTATSIKDPTHVDGAKNNTFYVFTDLNKDASFVDEELMPMYMYPDSERSTIFKIRNTGNSGDKTIRVNVTSIPEDWEVSLDLSDIAVGGLPRNSTADIEVTISTPEHVVESIYDIKLAAISNDEIKDEIILPVHVLKVRKISLRCMQAKKTGNVSERISFIVSVENNGNSKDAVDLSYSFGTLGMDNENWKIEMSKNITTLYPYESRDVIVSVFIPLDALADTNYLTLNVQEGYIIQIQGTSQNDTTVVADKEIEVVVNPIYDFEFNKQRDRKYLILHQTQIIDYSFKVSNKGNIWDLIDISFESNYTWIYIPYEQRKLLPGVTEELTINFDPPVTLGSGEYKFIIYGRSVNEPTLINELELILEIIDSDLELTSIMIGDKPLADANVKEGETVLVRALITNVGDLDYYNKTTDENIVIKFMEGSNYIGELNISFLASPRTSDENSVWVSYPWKVGKARTYTVIVKLDPYESFTESTITNNELSGKLEVVPLSGKKAAEEDEQLLSSDLLWLLIAIVIVIIIMILGIWANVAITRRAVKKGYTKEGEYKPYEERKKTEFEHEHEEEEEPEGGILGIHDEHPYSAKKSDKFMKEVLSITTMKPIRKTKPIKKSKPLTSLVGGRMGLEKPRVAGYLPPKPDSSDKDKEKPDEKEMKDDIGSDSKKTPGVF